MFDKIKALKLLMEIAPKVNPIIAKITKIRESQKHGDSQIISVNQKEIVVFKEYFKDSGHAQHFFDVVELLYAMNQKLPPIHVLVPLFRMIEPLLSYNELVKGNQTHGRPEIRAVRTDDGFSHVVILKEVFENKKDAMTHQEIAKKILQTKL